MSDTGLGGQRRARGLEPSPALRERVQACEALERCHTAAKQEPVEALVRLLG